MQIVNGLVADVDTAHQMAVRVEVAKDVLTQAAARRIFARRGVYVAARFAPEFPLEILDGLDGHDVVSDTDVQSLLPALGKCDVCAIGAAFLSYVRLFDRVRTGWSVRDENDGGTYVGIDRQGVVLGSKEEMGRVLGYDFAFDIEHAFEGWEPYGLDSYGRRGSLYLTVGEWGEPGSMKRLTLIMRNVIENGGEFAGGQKA